MAFIIGSSTITNLVGVQSVSVTQNPSIQYQYALGNTSPHFKVITVQTQISISTYGGQGYTTSLPVSTGCTDASTVPFSIFPGSCVGTVNSISGDYFLSGYSYSKQVESFGTQTYNLIDKPIITIEGQVANFPEPIMLRGQATGQAVNQPITGITFGGTTSSGISIQVNAGFPGIGNANDSISGEVSDISPGLFFQPGEQGNGSVTVPYNPLYVNP